MPLYEFGCEECGKVVEVLQKYNDAAPGCQQCSVDMRRHVSRTSFFLKGDGWARDSYGKYDITYGQNGGGRGMKASEIKRDFSALKG
jgi:putative FmdB family regulatory protein